MDDNKLVVFKKNILSKIKEKLEIKKEEIAIWKKKYFEEFKEKNKNSKLVNPDVIEIYCDDAKKEENDIELSAEQLERIRKEFIQKTEEYKKSQEGKVFKEDVIKSPEVLKEVYSKLKNNEISMDSLSEADLIKIYAISLNERELLSDKVQLAKKKKKLDN